MEFVKKVGKKTFVPITVGGGIREIKDIRGLLKSGAAKVSIYTAAILNEGLIKEC